MRPNGNRAIFEPKRQPSQRVFLLEGFFVTFFDIPRRRRRPPCPACGTPNPLPIIYGYPGPKLLEQARRGEVVTRRLFPPRLCGLALPSVRAQVA